MGDLEPDNGDDLLYGGAGNDWIYGADDADTIYGGIGDDFIDGGVDNDMLTGGKGADMFSFALDGGQDTITDFAKGEDMIGIGGGLTFADIFLSQDDSAAVIEAGDLMIRLEGVKADDLEEADFLF